jgi:sterol desaturase/sphingolipid hydroxylase (fatty acid hydroxylase superfamily)
MFHTALSYALWPALFGGAMLATGIGMAAGEHDVLAFNIVYFCFAAVIGITERLRPHERAWLVNDHQTFANLAHTVLSKGVVQVVVVISGTVGLAAAIQPPAGSTGGLWPGDWPMVWQVVLGLVIAELGLYWAHRLGHEIPLLWRFHAVHHSATRLWFINTGRFHFVDAAVSIVMGQIPLFLLGAPYQVFLWTGAVTAFIGMLTHCNIEMRFGPVSWIFNTPGLHRWHHSMVPEEGNTNYGENLMLWDQLFGTFFNPDRRPPAEIGIREPMPASFLGQLKQPFLPRSAGRLPETRA